MQNAFGLLVILLVWLVCEVVASEKPPMCMVQSSGIALDYFPPNEE